jgi:hypothetical protein
MDRKDQELFKDYSIIPKLLLGYKVLSEKYNSFDNYSLFIYISKDQYSRLNRK